MNLKWGQNLTLDAKPNQSKSLYTISQGDC